MKLSLPPTGFRQLEFLQLLQATAIPLLRSQNLPKVEPVKTLVSCTQCPDCLALASLIILILPLHWPCLSGLQPSVPYFYLFDPHSLFSAWNVPSSLPIELPTPSLRLASLFMPLLNLSQFVYLLIQRIIVECLSCQLPGKQEPQLVVLTEWGFILFSPFSTYR